MNSRFFLACLITFGMIQISYMGSAQTVWYVKTMGAGNGSSWAAATSDLQEAIDSAGTGDQIWIASGTYYPTVEFDADQSGGTNNREKTFYINKNIQIYGGFAGDETTLSQRSSSNVVILSGDIDMVPDTYDDSENAYHVLFIDGTTTTIDSTCLIDGLIIQDGYNGSDGGEIGYNGSGAYLNGSSGGQCSPKFSNCNFINNWAFFGDGAHMFNNGMSGNCSPIIRDCIFDSGVGRYGGAIYNEGSQGVCSPVIERCIFSKNWAYDGGAIYNDGFQGICSPQILHCDFTENTGNLSLAYFGFGGAIYHIGNSVDQPPLIANCKFQDNQTTWNGGALYIVGTVHVVNCLFNSNGGDAGGGAICNIGHSAFNNKSLFLNCTFYNNSTPYGNTGGAFYNEGDACFPEIINSIVWENQDEMENGLGASPKFINSIIQGAGGSMAWIDSFGIVGGNNLALDPMFVNPTSNDLQLLEGSPAINTGVNDSIPMEIITDINGDPRIVDGKVDRGVFEYQSCHSDLILDESDSPLTGSYFSTTTITIDGPSEILIGGNVVLKAPEVSINSAFSMPNLQQLDIIPVGCP